MNRREFTIAVTLAGLAGISPALASDYPTKPIRLIVPFAAGGPTDALARAFALQLGDALKQTVVVENKSGAGGNIGVDFVAKAPADGYIIGFGTNGPLAGNVALFKNIPYDPVKDLAPITRIAFVPNIIAVTPSLGAKNLQELIALLKANPEKYSFASGGTGTTQHLGGELLKSMTGTRMVHVPYKGEGPAMIDALGGQVPIIFSSLAVGIPYVQSGRLRALAVTSRSRSPALPDVPTASEAGVPGFELTAWYGLIGPAGTPPDILHRLNAASVQVIKSPQFTERLVSVGGTPAPSTPEEFSAFIRSEIPRWSEIVKKTGAKAE
ncbi:MAG: tripartite tricarboxylate transporter substrate binding protein [Polaromonas sp.]|nr:tripartite tricarboxylate transporter substrate binding protein [Polaromonas sp.]